MTEIGKPEEEPFPETRRIYEEELLFGEATENVTALLRSLDITQRELAGRLNVSEARVSQIVSGAENLTLRSLAALGWALGVRFELEPIAMNRAHRQGTPAENDPPAPDWLKKPFREVLPIEDLDEAEVLMDDSDVVSLADLPYRGGGTMSSDRWS